jgi:hypothetical protein
VVQQRSGIPQTPRVAHQIGSQFTADFSTQETSRLPYPRPLLDNPAVLTLT